MVRSKSEDDSVRSLLHLVDQIRSERKYFDVGLGDLAGELERNRYCEVYSSHETKDVDGSTVTAILRLNLAKRRYGCSAALKIHRWRIDGIDWERRFTQADGSQGCGWHRHEWDDRAQSGERLKIPLPGFDVGVGTVEESLIRICSELRIDLNADDVGFTNGLLLD
jgi:hypothetical protein